MQRKSIEANPEIQRYVLDHSPGLRDHHRALISDTEKQFPDLAYLQVPPEEALALRMIVLITGARRVLEIGTFTGLSSLMIAEALGPDGHLTCLDIDADTTALAARHWDRNGVADRISLRVGPAAPALGEMSGRVFDLVFLDADKPGYVTYFDAVLPMLEPGGLIVADNTLMRGRVLEAESDETAEAIRRFNRHVAEHAGVDVVLLPVYDGLTLIRKRP